MTGSARSRSISLPACVIGMLALAATLSACGSATTATGAGGSVTVTQNSSGAASSGAGSPSSAATSQASTAAASPQPTLISPVSGTGGMATPQQQLSAVPAGAKLTPFMSASASADGGTVYVQLESMGGACGQYDVVLQQSSTAVQVGLVHLASGGHICPQFMGPMRIAVRLSAPLAGRPVVDLANGQHLNVG